MTKRNTAKEAAMQALLAAYTAARELGRDYYREQPDLMLVAVARHAADRFEDKNQQIAFLQGYSHARSDSDAFKRGK